MAKDSAGPKVVISGYYGFDNCGDEAILFSMIKGLRRLIPNVELVILSGNPKRTTELYGVKAVDRWNVASIAKALVGAKLFISGGGSLIQDVTSTKSARYYFSVIKIAQKLKVKTMIFAQGIGPLNSEKIKRDTVDAFEKCDVIVVRDQDSADLLKKIGLKHEVFVGADAVMTLSTEDVGLDIGKSTLAELGILDSNYRKLKPILAVAMRNWGNDDFLKEVAKLLDNQIKTGYDVLLVPCHYPDDMGAISKITTYMEERCYVLGRCFTAMELMSLIANVDKVLSVRLHGVIFGMAFGVPATAISYDPKVESFMKQAHLENQMVPIDEFNWCELSNILNYQEAMPVNERLEQDARRDELKEAAWISFEKAAEMIRV